MKFIIFMNLEIYNFYELNYNIYIYIKRNIINKFNKTTS